MMNAFKYIMQILLSLCLAITAINAAAIERVTYYHNDSLGSPVAATDTNGNLLWREEYEPYGERLLNEDNGTNTLWYTGKQEEEAFGINYFGARWYDPTIGRFLAIDPVGFRNDNPQSFNRYAYANNNPYLYVDPDGRYADLAIEAISIGIGVASFSSNLNQGNYGAATVDAVGVLLDGVLAVVPGAPGAVGLGIQAAREGTEQAGKQLSKQAADKISDNTIVCRGGVCGADNFTNGTGVTTDQNGLLDGVSVGLGNSVEEASKNIRNNQVGVTTAGDIRSAGGEVARTGGGNHAEVSGITAQTAEKLFTPTVKNPNK